MALAFVESPEASASIVSDFYRRYLGRAADPVGLNIFVPALHRGDLRADVLRQIVASEEYFDRS